MTFNRTANRVLFTAAAILVGAYLLLPPLSRTLMFRNLVKTTLAETTGYDVVLPRFAVGYDLSVAAGDEVEELETRLKDTLESERSQLQQAIHGKRRRLEAIAAMLAAERQARKR
jgi:hypothetical protein